jgi:NADPH2:quinone reductase
VQGAAGAVGQALLVLGRLAGLELWGAARGAHAALIRELGATPIDYQHEDLYACPAGRVRCLRRHRRRRLWPLVRGAQAPRPALRLRLHGGRAGAAAPRHHVDVDSACVSMEAAAELVAWRQAPPHLLDQRNAGATSRLFREDLLRLFGLLQTGSIRPHVAERISFDEVAEAHRRLEAGGLEDWRRDADAMPRPGR